VENLTESFLLLVVGMSGVFLSLMFLAGMIWTFRFADEELNKRRIKKYAAKVETKQVEDDINDELVAVIVAAASATLHKAVTVRRVQFLGQQAGGAWSVTGRLNIMASHAISKRKSTS
jgi:sodium pump decarboxylase gamma subunit